MKLPKFYHTGCAISDYCWGTGLPRGQFSEVLGEPDSGKTTLVLCYGVSLQEEYNGIVRYIDAEGHTDKQHVRNIGMDCSSKFYTHEVQPPFEDVKKMLWEWVLKTKRPQMVIVDTIGSVHFKEYKDEMPVALRARKWRAFLTNGFLVALRQSSTTLIFNNHISAALARDYTTHVASIESPCGKAIKFLASRRMLVSKFEDSYATKKGEKRLVGFQARIKNIKGKILPPFEPYKYCRLFIKLEGGLQPWYSCLLYLSKEQKKKDGVVELRGERKKPMHWMNDMDEDLQEEIKRSVLVSWIGGSRYEEYKTRKV